MAITSRYPSTRPSTSVNLNRKKILIPGVKFSRSSVGTYVDENGLIKNAEYNEPRFNYDSETGEFLGLLVEETRTNSTRNSTDLSSTSPYYSGASGGPYTFLTNQTVAPDGTTTAGSILFTGGYCGFAINFTGVTDPTITVSLFAKYITGSANTHVRIQLSPFGGTDNYGLFNLTNGTSSASGSVVTSSNVIMTPFPNGWYRCSVTATHSTTWPQNSGDIRIWFHGETPTQTPINNTDRTYVWGVQLEAGSYPTSYIPTSGSTVTREADIFELPIKTFKSGRIQYSSEIAGNSYYGNIALKDSINTPEYSLEIGSANSLPTISTKFSNVLQSTASLTKLPSTTTKAFSLSFNFDKDTGKIDFSTPVSDDADASVLELPSKSSRKIPSGYSIDTLQVLPGTNIKEVYLWNEELDVNELSSLSEDFASINTQVVETEGYSANRSDYNDLPSLDLNFARNKSLDDNLSGENLITFTRSSTGTYYDANGVIQIAAVDTPRFDHDPDTLESLGLLVEESRTNVTPNSEDFSDSSNSNCTVTPNTQIAPDGTLTADTLQPSSTSNARYARMKGSVTTTNTYTVSVFAKAGTTNYFQLAFSSGGSYVNFDLGLGVAGTSGGGAYISHDITPVGNGWYRCYMVFTGAGTGSGIIWHQIVESASAANLPFWTPTGNETIHIWGAQLEEGSFPTSYIPTPATFTSRNSTATYYDVNGAIQTAAVDVPRDAAYLPDENGYFRPAGLLLEEERTNDYTANRLLNDNLFTGLNVNIDIGTGVTAPDGSSSFTTFTTTSATNQLRCYPNITHAMTPNEYWTCSIYVDVKNSSPGTMIFALGSAGSNHNQGRLTINANKTISTSTFRTVTGGAWDRTVPITSGYQDLGNGIYRVYYVVQNQDGFTGNWYLFGYYPSGNLPEGWTISLWGAQVEKGYGMTSFIPTETVFSSRSSTATYYDENGVIQTAGVDVARDAAYLPDRNGILRPVENLIEPAATNYLRQSGSVGSVGIVNNIITSLNDPDDAAPDGTFTATRFNLEKGLVDPGASAYGSRIYQGFNAAAGTYTQSLFFKPVVSKSKYLNPPDQVEVDNDMFLILGSDGTSAGGVNLNTLNPVNSSSKVTKIGNSGWYRVSVTVELSTADSDYNNFVYFINRFNSSSDPYPVGSEECLVWGWQVESGSVATSYIPTTTAQVTRAADLVSRSTKTRVADVSSSSTVTRAADFASITGSNFSSFYNQSEGTWLASYKRGVSSGFSGKTGVVTGISPNEYYYAPIVDEPLGRGFSNRTYTEIFDNPTVAIGSNVLQTGTYNSIIGQATLCVNGRSVVSSVANGASYATIISITIGGGGNANYRSLNSHISNLTYWPTRLPDTTLQEITSSTVDTFDLVFDSSLVPDGICGLKIRGTCTYTIDWGDGTDPDTIVNTGSIYSFSTITHQYFFPSRYVAKIQVISGDFMPYYTNQYDAALVEIKGSPAGFSFGTVFDRAFTSSKNLTYIDPNFDISSITVFGNTSSGDGAWRNCSSLTSFPRLDFNSAISIQGAWYGCTSLESFPKIDTSTVTNVGAANQGTWELCTSLTSFPLIDTSNATVIERAWKQCSNLKEFPAIDTSNCTNIRDAWNNCSNLEYFPYIDTSNVTVGFGLGTSGRGTWRNLSKIKKFPALNTPNITGSLDGAWAFCSSLTDFPLMNFSGITSFGTGNQGAWESCSSLENFPQIDTSSGTIFYKAWKDCSSLTSFPLIDTSNATDISGAWNGCTSLREFPAINTSNVTTAVSSSAANRGAWYGCSSLVSFPALDLSNVTVLGYANGGCWSYCTSLLSFPSINFAACTSFYKTWVGCSSLTSFASGCFDNSPATDYTQAFQFCSLSGDAIGNILSSINNANTSSGILHINLGKNAGNYDWNGPAWDGYNGLISRGWTISYNEDLFSSANTPLDLQFAATKTLDSRITFTRGSTGTYVDANGVIQTAAVDTARFDHDPDTLESLGLLIEESRTNLAIYSEYYKGVWTIQTGASVIPNQAIAPNGEKTASLFKGTGNTSSGVFLSNITVSGSSNNTKSIYLRSVSGTSTAQLKDPNNTQTIITCNLTTEWQRFILTETQSGGSAGIWIDKIPTEGIYVWGAQLEEGSFPTSYIPTPATFTSRASTATYYDANGIIQTAGVDVARDDAYLPDENGVMRPAGLLLEEAGTNSVDWSQGSQLYTRSFATINSFTGSLVIGEIFTSSNGGQFKLVAYQNNVVHFSAVSGDQNIGNLPLTSTSGSITSLSNINFLYNTASPGANSLNLSADPVISPLGNSITITSKGFGFTRSVHAASQPCVFSIYFKVADPSVDRVYLQQIGGGDGDSYRTYLLNSDTFINFSGSGSSTGVQGVEKLANGWYRFYWGRSTILNPNPTFVIEARDSSNSPVTYGAYLDGAQIEDKIFPTSYIPTAGSTVTRAADVSSSSAVTRSADVASITGTDFSSWFNSNQGTFFTDCNSLSLQSAISRLSYNTAHTGAFALGTGAPGPGRMYAQLYSVLSNNTITVNIFQYNGGGTDFGPTISNVIPFETDVQKVAFYTDPPNQLYAVASANQLGTLDTNLGRTGDYSYTFADMMRIGYNSGYYGNFNGTISRLTYWPKRLPDGALKYITQ